MSSTSQGSGEEEADSREEKEIAIAGEVAGAELDTQALKELEGTSQGKRMVA
jgi:hypothetical protein